MRSSLVFSFLATAALLITGGCRKKTTPAEESEERVLLTIDGEQLTMESVVSRIPVGIDPADSAALFKEIVDVWVSERILGKLAQRQLPNIEEIERKAASYRNRLIAREYLRQMRESKEIKVPSDSVRRFYDVHKSELLTERPLVKGLYLKIPSSSEWLDEVRRLMADASDESMERIESHFGSEVLQYDYFANVWVDWQTVADLIPYRFYDPDAFLKSTRDFETSYNGSTYILHITDYLPSGSEQPFEFAKSKIEAILRQISLSAYEENLVVSLLEKGIKDGKVVKGEYDPVSHRLTHPGKLEKKKERQ